LDHIAPALNRRGREIIKKLQNLKHLKLFGYECLQKDQVRYWLDFSEKHRTHIRDIF